MNTCHGPFHSLFFAGALGLACLARADEAGKTPIPDSHAPAPDSHAPAPGVRTPREPSSALENASQELLDLKSKIRAVEAEAAERRKSQEARLNEVAAERKDLDRAVQVLTDETTRLEKDVAARKESLTKDDKESARLATDTKAVVEPLKGFLDRLESHVTSGIAWRQDLRKKEIEAARKLLADPSTTPAQALAAAGRLEAEEMAMARLIEPGTVEVNVRGEKRALPGFHLGLLAVVYASEDGTIAGFSGKGQKPEDGLLEGPDAAAAARSYLTAIEVLKRRLSPRLVEFHVPSLAVGKEEEAK